MQSEKGACQMSWVFQVTTSISLCIQTSGPALPRCDTPSVPTGHHRPRLHGQVTIQRPVRLDRAADQPRPPQQEGHGRVRLGEDYTPSAGNP